MSKSQNSEKGSVKTEASSARDEIILRASEMQMFKDVVQRTSDNVEAIREVRGMLANEFSEMSKILQEEPVSGIDNQVVLARSKNSIVTPKPPTDFLIAKAIVDLLREKKK